MDLGRWDFLLLLWGHSSSGKYNLHISTQLDLHPKQNNDMHLQTGEIWQPQGFSANLKMRQGFYLSDRQPGAVCFGGSPPQRDSHQDDHRRDGQRRPVAASALCRHADQSSAKAHRHALFGTFIHVIVYFSLR